MGSNEGQKRLQDALEIAKIESDLDKKHWNNVKQQYIALGMN